MKSTLALEIYIDAFANRPIARHLLKLMRITNLILVISIENIY